MLISKANRILEEKRELQACQAADSTKAEVQIQALGCQLRDFLPRPEVEQHLAEGMAVQMLDDRQVLEVQIKTLGCKVRDISSRPEVAQHLAETMADSDVG